MEDIIKIQVLFTITQDGNTLTDALYFTQEQFDALTSEELDQMKQDRFDRWVANIIAASNSPAPEPTEEELQAELQAIQEQKAVLEQRETEIISIIGGE